MTPEYLRSSYKQYKADSDAIATWLANTARKCGFPHDLVSKDMPLKKQPKLKGRARKLARDAESKNKSAKHTDSTTSKDSQKYIIAIKDFVPLAQWILKSTKPVVDIPAATVTILDRTIEARKQHNRWWHSKDGGSDSIEYLKQANGNHGHFIDVLEQVRDALRPLMPSGRVETLVSHATKDSILNFTNRFSVLEVSQPATSSRVLQADLKPKTPLVEPLRFTVEQEPDRGEVDFAVDCFFHDIDNIRQYLQKVWNGYKRGDFDIVTASLVTNTAIEFVRGIEEEIALTFSQHVDIEAHLVNLEMRAGMYAGCSYKDRECEGDEMNFSLYDELDRYLLPTHMLLSKVAEDLQPNDVPRFNSDEHGIYDAKIDPASKTAREKFREDKALLLKVLPDFCILASTPDLIMVEDDMIQGVRKMVTEKSVPMWLTFTTQIFLDVNHILRDQIGRGFEDLHKSASSIADSISGFLRDVEKRAGSSLSESCDELLADLHTVIKLCIREDIVQIRKKEMTQDRYPPITEPFLLLRHHPLLSGLLCFKIKAFTQQASMYAINASGAILSAAHLYNAIYQEKLLADRWIDMDLVLAMHSTKDMFVGSFPVTIPDYFKRYTLAMGISVASFASRPVSRRMLLSSRAEARSLNDLWPVSRMFLPRFESDHGITKFSPKDVEIIMNRHPRKGDTQGSSIIEDGDRMTLQSKVESNDESNSTNGCDYTFAKHRKCQGTAKSREVVKGGIPPVQLLATLLSKLQSESVGLTFDYLRMHLHSCLFVEVVEGMLLDNLKRHYGPDCSVKKDCLSPVICFIFISAFKDSRAHVGLELEQEGIVTRRLLEKAAEVIRQMVEAGHERWVCNRLESLLGKEIDVPDIATQMRT